MKKYIGIALIVASLAISYKGVSEYSNSGESIDIVGIEISAENNKQKNTSCIYLGCAVVMFLGGIILVNRK